MKLVLWWIYSIVWVNNAFNAATLPLLVLEGRAPACLFFITNLSAVYFISPEF